VIDGKYGPYLTDGNKNANLPKGSTADDLTLEQATALIAAAPEKKGGARKGGARKFAAKKAAPKKAAAKKAAPKKAAAKKAAKKKA
jgi:DNA topoisomerase-1